MIFYILYSLLLAALPRLAFASKQSLWEEFTNGRDLDSTIGPSSQALLCFTSRTFDSVHNHYDILEKLQTDQQLHTRIMMIDCDVDINLCRQYDVNEYPAIRLLVKSKAKDELESEEISLKRYRGRKTERAIRSFLVKHEQAIPSFIGDVQALSGFKKVDDLVIVAFLNDEWSELNEVFHSVAAKYYENFVFGSTHGKNVKEMADAEGLTVPSIVCYKNADGDHKVLNGVFTERDVEAFLATAPKMVIGDFSERNVEAYMAPGKLSAYIFSATADDAQSLRHELTPIAKKYEQYVTFGVADAYEYGPMATNFGLVNDRFPALAVHAPMNDNVFIYLQGRKIVATVVETMLLMILQGEATSGQVFGNEAPGLADEEGEKRPNRHDEL